MNRRAKTYNEFINEAYVDASGELQDFTPLSKDNYDVVLTDEASRLRDFLEEVGADGVRLSVDDPYITIIFRYGYNRYFSRIDLEEETIEIYSEGTEIYSDSLDSFIDVVNANGLDFLNY